MRIGVIGAGVIGSVYAARFAAAGHDVVLLARGNRLKRLTDDGLRVRSRTATANPRVRLLAGNDIPAVDILVVAVRATHLAPALPLLAATDARAVVLLQHLGPMLDNAVAAIGEDRAVLAFPGIGGLIHEDGIVEYIEIGAQPTTIDRSAPQAELVREAIRSTGMRTAMEPDIRAWFATHEIFVSCIGTGILACGGDARRLSRSWAALTRVVSAIREGFAALRSSGFTVAPTAIRVLFSTMPRWFATAYWRRELKGPVGTVALAPHVRASRDDEFPELCRHVLDSMAGQRTPTLNALLKPIVYRA